MSIPVNPNHRRAWLTLIRAPGLGPSTIRTLLARHGDVMQTLASAQRDSLTPAAARSWLAAPDERRLDQDEIWLDAPDRHLVLCGDDDFPILLRDLPNAPIALFVRGDPTRLWSPQIAIVGSRSASAGGLSNARAFARAFVQAGNSVTSGLAEGIDGAAHTAALDAGGTTIAVLGTGIDIVYPRKHGELAERVIANGALVSEFAPGTPGHPTNFPRRNRIICGLSLGTLVVEASLKSGSLTTARYAAEQGREVFAIPGSIHSPLSRGCHKLIREGAKLVETAQEVLEDLHGASAMLATGLRARLGTEVAPEAMQSRPITAQSIAPTAPRGPIPARRNSIGSESYALLKAIEHVPAALDELSARTGLSAATLSAMLLTLELDGLVTMAGGRYVLRT